MPCTSVTPRERGPAAGAVCATECCYITWEKEQLPGEGAPSDAKLKEKL